MKSLLRTLASPLVLGTLGMAVLSALVWWIGPLVSIGQVAILADTSTRIVTLAVLWVAWAGYVALRIGSRRRRNAMLLQGIGGPQSAADREGQVLKQRFDEAIGRLQPGAGWRRALLGRSDGLYGLPWYMFIGAPGSGKTTALLNAGLHFVVEDPERRSVQGIGGTRNCDWWFTREAVLIDTAGRYTLQESDRSIDSAAWNRFLSLLRQARPRRPINGVLLTVNVQDLLQQDDTLRQEHAVKLRSRLAELQAKLGVRPPVYVLVTKADLIGGFTETFELLGKEDRDQVWGFTFRADRFDPSDPLRDFESEYRLLQERLGAGLLDRLRAERDPVRRGLIFGFGSEFAALRPVLSDFLQRVFGSSAGPHEGVTLRGVYFTSGTQEGTPIDRVMGMLSRTFGMEERASRPPSGRGRSYFLRRLLQDVVFAESHLVSFNAAAERRRRMTRVAGFAAVGVAALLVVAGWAVSYLRNVRHAEEVAARVPPLRAAAEALPSSGADVLRLLPVLDAAATAGAAGAFPVDDPPLLHTLGLYQGEKLDAGAQAGYQKLLQNGLAPRVVRRLEERLRASNRNNLEQAYEALKAYLMVYSPQHFNAEALKAWVEVDWDEQLRQLAPEQRQALDRHLDAMLALGAPAAIAPADAQLVAGTRDMLASFPLEYRIYSRLHRRYRAELPEFTVAGAAGPQAANVLVRASGEPLSRGVPGLYTRDGYAKVFQQGPLARVSAQMAAEDAWVLGRASRPVAVALGAELENRVRRLYLEDYARHWERLLADVRLAPPAGLQASIDSARVLSGPDSPMAAFLRAAARETVLSPAAREPSALGQAAAAANQAKKEISRLVDTGPAPVAGQGPIERIVDDRFASLHRLFAGQPAPIEQMTRIFADVHAQLAAVDAAQKSRSTPPPVDAVKLKAAAAQLPPSVQSAVQALVDSGTRTGREAEQSALAGELRPIYEFCARAVANRYPLAAGSRADVLPGDFGQLFAPGGLLDEFFQRRLAHLVDTGTNPWSYKPLADGSRPAAQGSLAEFQRAARIRDVFFRGGGRMPNFRHDLRAVEFSGDVKEVKLEMDGQVTTITPGSTASLTVPAPRAVSQLRVHLGTSPPLQFEGPWAAFRMFDHFEVLPAAQPERFGLLMIRGASQARLEVVANSAFNPYRMRELRQFRCPGSL
ncbi:type VI secretion system membrane subunit TssM [Ramlibacter sp. AW1]|uniref:Type VI secretion system membrane subunit TssM n=1 Tax=Ramlibacter aurantiacus TaxID=2801330 RepID=A0A937D0N8_9BURK|nr:type VI secretion system membrane subunit TssM [Ramlibacter aurantiacus]MBL0419629.1 type VI secretion system membrane subunit TssM [Ramlibacter aurantiacus]